MKVDTLIRAVGGLTVHEKGAWIADARVIPWKASGKEVLGGMWQEIVPPPPPGYAASLGMFHTHPLDQVPELSDEDRFFAFANNVDWQCVATGKGHVCECYKKGNEHRQASGIAKKIISGEYDLDILGQKFREFESLRIKVTTTNPQGIAERKTVYIAGMPEAQKDNRARIQELGNMLREGGYEVTGRQTTLGGTYMPPEGGKEPWQMTYSEFFPIAGSEYTSGERFGIPTKNRVPVIPETGFGEKGATPEERIHRAVVRKALREKKPVPQEVLAVYPDLARIYGKTGNHLPPVKEPWQMTKEEFKKTASPLKNREDFIKAWLRDNENIPNKVRQGINRIPQRDGALLVYGNEKGETVSVLSFRKDAVDAIAVSDRYKNRGIATLLLEDSRKYGVRRTEGLISPEFAGIAHRFAVKTAFLEGKPIPPEVLREYPDLMMKAENQRWRKA